MSKLETTMDAGQKKMAAMQRKLYNVRQIVSQSNLITATIRRKQLIGCFEQVIQAIADDIKILPRRLLIDGKDVIEEFRRVQRGCVSIIQALNDRACTKTEAVVLGKKISRRIRGISRLLLSTDSIESKTPLRDPFLEGIEQITDDKISSREEAINSANKPEILKSFDELQRYKDAMEDLKKRARLVEETEKNIPGRDPKPESEKIEHYDAGQGQYGERLSEDAERWQHLLHSVQQKIPTSISLSAKHDAIRVNSPLLVVTDRFVSDNVLKSANITFARMFSATSLTPGYVAGYGKNKDVHISPILLYNQMLVALPLATAMDRNKFDAWLEDSITRLGVHIGGVTPIAIGTQTVGKIGGETIREKQAERMTEHQQLLITKRKELSDQIQLERIRAKKSKEPYVHPSMVITPDEFEDDLSTRQIRKQSPKKFRVLDDKKRFFVNRHFPGTAFVWIVLNHHYSKLSQIRFLLVDFPFPPSGDVKVGKSAQERESFDRMDKLKQQREELQGGLPARIARLDKYYRIKMQQLKDLKDELFAHEEVLVNQRAQLAEIRSNKNSEAWRAAHHAATLTELKISEMEGSMDALLKDILPKLRTVKKAISDELDRRIKAKRDARNK